MKTRSEQHPEYPFRPIRNEHGLEAALRVPIENLKRVAAKADLLYRKAKPIDKGDGTIRQTFDALPELKCIQIRIKNILLSRVNFPPYLTGSLKGRDYRVNARFHVDAKVIVCEDIANFFPSTSTHIIRNIWANLFGFSADVSDLLTALTTKDGFLPQGAVTSSYLANLAFFSSEPTLQALLAGRSIRYSRYVDDITLSSVTSLSSEDLTWCISNAYGMLAKYGYHAKRRKHEIHRSNARMFTTKLMVNKRPALKPNERSAIRSAVYQLERKVAAGVAFDVLRSEFNSVRGRVEKLKLFHTREALSLKARLAAASLKSRNSATCAALLSGTSFLTTSGESYSDELPPW